MKIKRYLKHLVGTGWQLQRAFPQHTLAAIEHSIAASEAQHSGEIRFAVEAALEGLALFKGQSSRDRAIALFSQLGVWDTQHNNGLLIYLLLADRAVEIVADRGIAAKVSADTWQRICHTMEQAFGQSDFEGGVLRGLQAVTQQLVAHFPVTDSEANELPNQPVVL